MFGSLNLKARRKISLPSFIVYVAAQLFQLLSANYKDTFEWKPLYERTFRRALTQDRPDKKGNGDKLQRYRLIQPLDSRSPNNYGKLS